MLAWPLATRLLFELGAVYTIYANGSPDELLGYTHYLVASKSEPRGTSTTYLKKRCYRIWPRQLAQGILYDRAISRPWAIRSAVEPLTRFLSHSGRVLWAAESSNPWCINIARGNRASAPQIDLLSQVSFHHGGICSHNFLPRSFIPRYGFCQRHWVAHRERNHRSGWFQ